MRCPDANSSAAQLRLLCKDVLEEGASGANSGVTVALKSRCCAADGYAAEGPSLITCPLAWLRR